MLLGQVIKTAIISCGWVTISLAGSLFAAEKGAAPAWVSEQAGENSRHEQALSGLQAVRARSEFFEKYQVELKRHEGTLQELAQKRAETQQSQIQADRARVPRLPASASESSPSRAVASEPQSGFLSRAASSLGQALGLKTPATGSAPPIQLDGSQVPKEIEFPGKPSH